MTESKYESYDVYREFPYSRWQKIKGSHFLSNKWAIDIEGSIITIKSAWTNIVYHKIHFIENFNPDQTGSALVTTAEVDVNSFGRKGENILDAALREVNSTLDLLAYKEYYEEAYGPRPADEK